MRLTVRVDPSMSPFVAMKGSICIDGVSLTVNRIDGDDVSVLLIPHTIAVTTFQDIEAGQNVNVEVDMLARYARRLIAAGAIGFAEEPAQTTG
jgi:riboflavin synthase